MSRVQTGIRPFRGLLRAGVILWRLLHSVGRLEASMKTLQSLLGTGVLVAGCFSLSAPLQAQICSFGSGPDVIVGEITGPTNYSSFGGMEGLSLGTTSCNIGDQVLDWIAGTPDHPVIGGNLYRLKDYGGWWAMEQVGMSWLKHGFQALQGGTCCSNCTPNPGGGSGLGIGCSDPYTASRNGNQGPLGPRWQVNAYTGAFTYPPANPTWLGSTARRLEVAISDLEATSTTTTQYYGESHYVAPDDAAAGNNNNNASYRNLTVSGSGSSWGFTSSGSTQRERPAIMAWLDAGVDSNVQMTEFDIAGVGFFVLGHSVTDLGGGLWPYEYALYNMNSDDSIRAFSIPVGPGVTTQNLGFHDLPYRNGDGVNNINRDGTDWPAMLAANALTWQVVGSSGLGDINHNVLRWGSTYNFRFDANAPPVSGDLTLTTYKTEQAVVLGGVQVPSSMPRASAFCDASDGALASCPCANPGDPGTGCEIQQGTGGVGLSMVSQETSPQNRVTWSGAGFPAVSTPTSIVIRAADLDTGSPIVFGDGLRCIGTPLVRLAATFASGGTVTHTHGHGAGAGTGDFFYQLWFRNTPIMYCDPTAAFNLSNGWTLAW
jgi:hypothetical protein